MKPVSSCLAETVVASLLFREGSVYVLGRLGLIISTSSETTSSSLGTYHCGSKGYLGILGSYEMISSQHDGRSSNQPHRFHHHGEDREEKRLTRHLRCRHDGVQRGTGRQAGQSSSR